MITLTYYQFGLLLLGGIVVGLLIGWLAGNYHDNMLPPVREGLGEDEMPWDRIDTLTKQRDELLKDAERYRWLRGRTSATNPSCFSFPGIVGIPSVNLMRGSVALHLDAAIDATMGE